MSYGSMANDGGFLVLDLKDKEKMLSENAFSQKFYTPLLEE